MWSLRTLAQFVTLALEMFSGLFQDFIDWYIRLTTLAVEHIIVVMTAGAQSRQSQIEFYG